MVIKMKKCKTQGDIILTLLTLGISFLLSIPVVAAYTHTQIINPYFQESIGTNYPRYVALTQLSADLSIDSGGCAVCTGTADVALGYTCDVTLELQQKINSNWGSIKTWTSSGRTNSFDKIWFVKSGYEYRLQITANVYNLSNVLIESVVSHSGVIRY